MEVLRDPVHFEFFKRYMRMQKSEAPLFFWKAVELLKRTENPNLRTKKAQQILNKFFSVVAGGGEWLSVTRSICSCSALKCFLTVFSSFAQVLIHC